MEYFSAFWNFFALRAVFLFIYLRIELAGVQLGMSSWVDLFGVLSVSKMIL
jgi:hypothetical protein